MIAFTLALLFIAAAIAVMASLVDSAVRWRNAWLLLQQEMAAEQSGVGIAVTADVVAFRNIAPMRAGIAPLFATAVNQTAPQTVAIPTAAAA